MFYIYLIVEEHDVHNFTLTVKPLRGGTKEQTTEQSNPPLQKNLHNLTNYKLHHTCSLKTVY